MKKLNILAIFFVAFTICFLTVAKTARAEGEGHISFFYSPVCTSIGWPNLSFPSYTDPCAVEPFLSFPGPTESSFLITPYYTSGVMSCTVFNGVGGAIFSPSVQKINIMPDECNLAIQCPSMYSGACRNPDDMINAFDNSYNILTKTITSGAGICGGISYITGRLATTCCLTGFPTTYGVCSPSTINGACGAVNNACTAGTLDDIADDASNYLWKCLGGGSPVGSTASCSLSKSPSTINGACGAVNNACTAGTLDDIADDASNYLWKCLGGGSPVGSTASCSLSKSASLEVSVVGLGTVKSDIPGINCGSDCSENYSSGTTITLSATPATGKLFTGWGGYCTGTPKTSNCVVNMGSSNVFVSAKFVINPDYKEF
jgi:hypothetical protein